MMALEAAVDGVRRVLKEEKTDRNAAFAVKNCQALHLNVKQLLEQCRSSEDGGMQEREFLGLLCSCFSTAAQVLTLCKEVESGPGWLFEVLSSQLSPLFKSTFTLIKVSTELLDRLTFTQETLKNVLCRLRSLCSPVLNFDPSLPVLVWRGVAKVVCRARGVVVSGDECTIRPIISDLCVAMETKAVACVKSALQRNEGGGGGGDVGYVKLLKLCRFLAALLVKLVQEFEEDSSEFAADVAGLLVHLYRSVPPSPYSSPVDSHTQAEIDSNILLVCEPVFTSLLDCTQFFQTLLSPGENEGEGVWFGRLMCVSLLLKHFPKLSETLQDFVMDSLSAREDQSCSCRLLDTFFTAIKQCSVELQLPVRVAGVMVNGQPQKTVSLYEHILTHLCSFTACIPHQLFPKREAVLFRQAFSEDHSLSSLLAIDTLSFIARTEERIANGYANLLAQLLSQCLSGHAHRVACSLLQRMVPLLSPPHLSHFLHTHPPSSPSHIPLWAHLHITSLPIDLQNEVAQQLWDCSIQLIRKQLHSEQPHLPSIHWSLRCINSAHSHLPTPSHPHTLPILTQTWDWISRHDLINKSKAAVMCECLLTMTNYVSHMPLDSILKILSSLKNMITRGLPTAVCLAVSEFLSNCGNLNINDSNTQTPILRCLMSLFQVLLGHSSWLVLHCTLAALQTFVESTQYTLAVEECIPGHLKDVVASYLHRVPYLSSERSELREVSFWVRELGARGEREGRWREGERSNGDVTHTRQNLVASKMQLLLDTWQELSNLPLTTDVCQQLHELCTSIRSHLSQSPQLSLTQ